MKTLISISCLISAAVLFAGAAPSPPTVLKDSGFVKYLGEHDGVTFCAVSTDIGSAVPSQDFRLFAGVGSSYRLVLSLPMTQCRGYRCTCVGDQLKVFVTTTLDENNDPNWQPNDRDAVLSINLVKLLQAYPEIKPSPKVFSGSSPNG